MYEQPIITFIATILGAAIGALTSWLTTRSTVKASRQDELREIRRTEYFSAIEIAFCISQAFREFAENSSGRKEPGDDATSTERTEAQRRDITSANAVAQLFDAMNKLKLEAYRMKTIGDPSVTSCLYQLSQDVDDYLQVIKGDMPRFISAHYQSFFDIYQKDMDAFLTSIRIDLRFDKLL